MSVVTWVPQLSREKEVKESMSMKVRGSGVPTGEANFHEFYAAS